MKKRYAIMLFVLVALGAGLLWVLIEHEPVHEGWCELRRKASDSPSESALTTLASQALMPLPSAPNDVTDVPETFSDPSFYRMKAGTKKLTLVLDLSAKPRLCVDTDGNGSLSDERQFPVKSVKEKKYTRDRFGPIRIPPDGGDNQTIVSFYATIHSRRTAGSLWIYPTHNRCGKVRVGQNVYRIALMDGDCDGQLGSVVSLPVDNLWDLPQSDVFAIDYDRDGKFRRSDYVRSEIMPLGRMIRLQNAYFAVNISADENKLELEQVEPEQGRLAIDPPEATGELRLWSDAADQYIPFAANGLNLPAGKYQTLYAVLRLQDAQRADWTFSTNGNLGELGSFEIHSGKTTQVRLGPPFVVTSHIKQSRPGIIYVTPVLRGRAGEEYRLDFRRNNRRPPDRTFRIVSEDGTVLVQNKFKYG